MSCVEDFRLVDLFARKIEKRRAITYDAGHDASRAKACDGPADNEGNRVGCRSANGRPYFEKEDGAEKCSLGIEKGINLAEEKL
jgi:hypothetical protein